VPDMPSVLSASVELNMPHQNQNSWESVSW